VNNDLISIVLPTYNMSGALKFAIESVLYQTHRNFELLVVGDHCTDDSEQVVKAFADPRVHWFNLPKNFGQQWGPNNFGLERARGDIIAYFGHDDIWAPNHLAAALDVMVRREADVAVNMTVFYGPPGSKILATYGLFPNDVYTRRFFFPPGSMVHRRSLIDRAGPWRSPDVTKDLPDIDFVLRCHEAGAKIVPTRVPTLFKFSTTFRRDAYRARDVSELQRTLAAFRTDPQGFVTSQLVAVAQCAIEDRLHRFERTENAEDAPLAGQTIRGWKDFKGSHRRDPAALPMLGGEPVRFFLGDEFAGFEWHLNEVHPVHGNFRWSGPSTSSAILLPVRIDRATRVRLHIVHALEPATLEGAELSFNRRSVALTTTALPEGTWVIEGIITPADNEEESDPYVSLVVPQTARPLDVFGSPDRRWLGLAVNWVELSVVKAV
jgi:glycosyltransferase involved in cell wall biosynthesis